MVPAPTSASQGWWMRQPRSAQYFWSVETISWRVSPRGSSAVSRATSRITRCECRSRSRWLADEVAVEGLQRRRADGAGSTAAGGRREDLAQEVVVGALTPRARRPARRRRRRTRGRGGGSGGRPRAARRRSRRSGRAAGRSRAASAARPPGNAPAPHRVRLPPPRPDGQGQPVHRVLRLALLRERVEQLGEVRQRQRLVQAARRRRGTPTAPARTRPAGTARRPAGRAGRPGPRSAAPAPTGTGAAPPAPPSPPPAPFRARA